MTSETLSAGHDVHDESVRSAIGDAGYEIAQLHRDAR